MQRQGLEPAKRVAYFEYDFARDGGAVGDIAMRGDALPEGAIITSGMVQVIAAVTSGGAATAIRVTTAGTRPVVTVAVAALTAGKLICALEYL